MNAQPYRLRMLAELHRLGSLAKVAEVMSYSPSAISQQLGVLEKETGVKLLQPVGRGVRLTQDGVALAGHTRAVLQRLEVAESELAHAVTGRTSLRLASFQTALLAIVTDVIKELDEHQPNICLEYVWKEVKEAYEGLLSHDYDLILGEEFPGVLDQKYPGCERIDLMNDRMFVALPSALENITKLSDLAEHTWTLNPADTSAGRWERNLCRTAGFEPRIRFETPDPLSQTHLARAGLAVTFLPSLLAQDHFEGFTTLALPEEQSRKLYLAIRSGTAAHPAIVGAIERFKDVVARRPALKIEGNIGLE